MDNFDSDTLRNACNAAFHALGRGWCWDHTFPIPCTGIGADNLRNCLRDYLNVHQAHMLKAYNADFLVDAILAAMAHFTSGV